MHFVGTYVAASGQQDVIPTVEDMNAQGFRNCTGPCSKFILDGAATCPRCGADSEPLRSVDYLRVPEGGKLPERPEAQRIPSSLEETVQAVLYGLPRHEGYLTLTHEARAAISTTSGLGPADLEFIFDLSSAAVDANNAAVTMANKFNREKNKKPGA